MALGGANGICSATSTCWMSRCAACARLRTTWRLVGARAIVEIVDIDVDLEVDLAGEGLESVVDCVEQPDLGPSGGGRASRDDADVGADAAAAS